MPGRLPTLFGAAIFAAQAIAGGAFEPQAKSRCFGSPKAGRIEGAVSLSPESSGPNFSPYHRLGVSLGRTYVHSSVSQAARAAYAALAKSRPETRFVYGETGFRNGGRFRPHKTHQNGTSVDFMVPVLDRAGRSVPLPCGLTNKFCYGIEFDSSGRWKDLTIDFDAIAAHLAALDAESKRHGIPIERVIFDPDLTALLKSSQAWRTLNPAVVFSPHKPWVRHDEHYHVDFAVPCGPL